MTPEDLSKFNIPGNKLRMTIEAEVRDGSSCSKMGYTLPSLLLELGGTTESGDNRGSVSIPDAAIVSVKRVLPELPGAWEWEAEANRSAVIKSPMTRNSVMARVSGAGVETFGQAVELSSLAAVIEAVRNA